MTPDGHTTQSKPLVSASWVTGSCVRRLLIAPAFGSFSLARSTCSFTLLGANSSLGLALPIPLSEPRHSTRETLTRSNRTCNAITRMAVRFRKSRKQFGMSRRLHMTWDLSFRQARLQKLSWALLAGSLSRAADFEPLENDVSWKRTMCWDFSVHTCDTVSFLGNLFIEIHLRGDLDNSPSSKLPCIQIRTESIDILQPTMRKNRMHKTPRSEI